MEEPDFWCSASSVPQAICVPSGEIHIEDIYQSRYLTMDGSDSDWVGGVNAGIRPKRDRHWRQTGELHGQRDRAEIYRCGVESAAGHPLKLAVKLAASPRKVVNAELIGS